ncbi:MAG: SDR family NAD(P)-dependent oxidoreductase, partial [Salinibacter sp.]|uniref:SDR family NAD(P)-dependent oxidoreductase n=1 Tax=Salinibacter sp. TaxID=2065818 RepID=UPI002FC33FA2
MDLHLDDKTALVTGGSKGIGYGCAEALAAEGCDLSICARHGDELAEAAAALRAHGVDVRAIEADLTVDADIDALVTETLDAFGTVDVLVNNAGTVGTPGGLQANTTQDWRALFE